MRKEDAKKEVINMLEHEFKILDLHGEISEKILNFCVDELGMLPPTRDLEHFPGKTDNSWED